LVKINNDKLNKLDIILINEYKYIVYRVTRKSVELLPISNLLGRERPIDVIPKISIDIDSLGPYEKIDRYEILYLLNQTNPLIIESLEYFFENEK